MIPSRLPTGSHRLEGVSPFVLEIPEPQEGSLSLVLALHYAFPDPKPEPYTGGRLLDALRPGLTELNAILLAPDSLGGRWTEPANEEMAVSLVRSVIQAYPVDPKRVLITGFSRGGEGTWHIGSRHQDLYTGAIPIAAPVAGGDSWSIPVYCIHAECDEIVSFRAAKEHCEKLNANGAKIEFRAVPDFTHYQTAAYAPHLAEGVRWMMRQWK